MLTNFFGKSKPITFLVILALFLSLSLIALLTNKIDDNYLKTILLFLFMLGTVIFINRKNNLSFDNSYVFFIFILLIGIFPNTIKINSVFYSNLTLLFFLRKTYSLQSKNESFKKLFDAGLWLGISCIIEPFSLIFAAMLYLSIYLHQHFTFQKIVIPIIGFFVPVFLFFTYCFWFNKMELFYIFSNWYTYYDFSLYNHLSYKVPLYVISTILFIAVIIKTPKALSIKNDFRRSWILVLLNLLCSVSLVLTSKYRNGSEFLYLLFPSAIIIANIIEVYEKKWFSDVFIILLTLFSFTMCII